MGSEFKVKSMKTKYKIQIAETLQNLVKCFFKIFGFEMKFVCKRSNLNWHLDLNEGIDFSIWLLGSFESSTIKFYKNNIFFRANCIKKKGI